MVVEKAKILLYGIFSFTPKCFLPCQQDFRTGGTGWIPGLGQYSFQGLMMVIMSGFIILSPLSIVAWQEYCVEYW